LWENVSLLSEDTFRKVFRAAGIYNILWGAAVSLFPNLWFDLFGIPHINYPFVMAGLGMCIGLYGYGYWVVSQDLRRYPQIVLIGFLGKAIGPVGWAYTVMTTDLPLRTMWTNVFNDFIWLPFFAAYLIWYRRQSCDLPAASQD
jgi:hypothetical protein